MNYRHHPRLLACARTLHGGGVVAYPTEAVWGLGCLPFHQHAVQQILSLKHRPASKGLILVAARIQQLEFILCDLTARQRQPLEDRWPGPWTFLVPHQDRLPACVTGEHSSVAVRVSAHPVVAALCDLAGGPIVSTSANPQGLPPARFGFQARRYFRTQVAYAPGRVDLSAKPSRICDLLTGEILRP